MTDEPREAATSRAPDPGKHPEIAEAAMSQMIRESLGGWRGFVDSGLPAAAFVVGNLIWGLQAAIWAGAMCGVLIFALRLVRRESIQQALAGLIGVVICIVIARQTGEARGFFVFGIIRNALVALAFLGSMVIGRPLVGVVWNLLAPSAKPWREDPRQMRAFQWVTAAWAAGFAMKFVIEGYLWLIDSPTGLGAVRLALGYPLTIGLVVLTILVVGRVRDRGPAAGGAATTVDDPTAPKADTARNADTAGNADRAGNAGDTETARRADEAGTV